MAPKRRAAAVHDKAGRSPKRRAVDPRRGWAWCQKPPCGGLQQAAGACIEVLGTERVAVAAPSAAAEALRTEGGVLAGRGRWQLPAKAFGRVLGALVEATTPPPWALVALGRDFRRHSEAVAVPKKTACVLLRELPEGHGPPWRPAPAALPHGSGWPPSLQELRSADGRALMPYQREAVDFGLRNGGRVLLGDEMGLGKTAQALALAAHYADEWPVLVVCPSSLCSAWAEEAAQWLPPGALGIGDSAIQVLARGAEVQRRLARVIIVSYDLLARHERFQQRACGSSFRVVICDEAHFLKSTDSQRTQAVLPLLQRARRTILLTGTPAVNNAAELYPLVDALLPGLVPSKAAFFDRYCLQHQIVGPGGRRTVVWRGSARPDELHRMLLRTVMIRRLKAQVLLQLPRKLRQRVRLDEAKLCKRAMAEMAQLRAAMRAGAGRSGSTETLLQLVSDLAPTGGLAEAEAGGNATVEAEELSMPMAVAATPQSANQMVAEMARLTCEAKAGAVADYVECVVLAGVRFLLFAHHRAMLDALQERLKSLDVCHIRIDGSTSLARRSAQVARFQQDEGVQVALLSITACGQGLNLQSASLVVFAELHWVVGQMLQAEDRVHRMGQTTAVNVQYLVAPETLDEAMHEVLNRKHRDTTATLDGRGQRLPMDAVGPSTATASLPGAEPALALGGPEPAVRRGHGRPGCSWRHGRPAKAMAVSAVAAE